MSTTKDRPETRGDRVRAVREALELKQPEFAALLNVKAGELGLPAVYDNTKVSRMESRKGNVSGRKVTLDDAIVVSAADPKDRGVHWLAGVRKMTKRLPPAGLRLAVDSE